VVDLLLGKDAEARAPRLDYDPDGGPSLPLPQPAWRVRFRDEAGRRALLSGRRRHLVILPSGDPLTVFLDPHYDLTPLEGDPRVESVERVWYVPRDDAAAVLADLLGTDEDVQGVEFHPSQEAALLELSERSPPVRQLLGLRAVAPASARPLVQQVLDGDLAQLPVLANALARERHPSAGEVRDLAGRLGLGRRQSAGLVRDADSELARAQEEAAGPCPGCGKARKRQAFRTLKEGPNLGRIFLKCKGCGRFDWWPAGAAAPAASGDAERDALEARATPCPKCGQPRRALRVRKEGRNQGRLFLACSDRACDSFEWAGPAARAEAPAGPPPARRGEERLLEAIRAAPEEDGPCLEYAAWLEGQGERGRAELVRVQCALAGLPATDRRTVPLRRRERELLGRHGADWAGELAGLVLSYAFRRGLLEQVGCTALGFAAQAADICRLAPVRSLTAFVQGWQGVRALARVKELVSLRELRLEGPIIGGAGARILADTQALANLTALALPEQNIGRPGVEALTKSRHLARLRFLDLSRHNIGKGGMKLLAESPHLAGLTTLLLRDNGMTDPEAFDLAAGPGLARLHTLDVAGSAFTAVGACAILDSEALADLRTLVLGSKWPGRTRDHVGRVVQAAGIARLTSLTVAGSGLTDEAVAQLVGGARVAGLTFLGLPENRLSAAGVEALAASPHLEGLTGLDLGGNRIGSEGLEALARSPLLARLHWLGLAGCGVGDAGLEALAASPHLRRPLMIQAGDEGVTGERKAWEEEGYFEFM
jgi:uncharacterized protein (TIGR02996 family)